MWRRGNSSQNRIQKNLPLNTSTTGFLSSSPSESMSIKSNIDGWTGPVGFSRCAGMAALAADFGAEAEERRLGVGPPACPPKSSEASIRRKENSWIGFKFVRVWEHGWYGCLRGFGTLSCYITVVECQVTGTRRHVVTGTSSTSLSSTMMMENHPLLE